MSLFLKTNDFPKGNDDEIWSDFSMTVPSKKSLRFVYFGNEIFLKMLSFYFFMGVIPDIDKFAF